MTKAPEKLHLDAPSLSSTERLPPLPSRKLQLPNVLLLLLVQKIFTARTSSIRYLLGVIKMTPEYKAEKEESVSYLGGGGMWEINFVTLIAPVSDTKPAEAAMLHIDWFDRSPHYCGPFYRPDRAFSSHIQSRRSSRTFYYTVLLFCLQRPCMAAPHRFC
jgi:hypothetical protein